MFNREPKFSQSSAERVLDYLIFRVSQGASLTKALTAFANSNQGSKDGELVACILADINNGQQPQDAMLKYGMINKAGYVILSSGIQISKALPVIRQISSDNKNISSTVFFAFSSPLIFMAMIGLSIFVFSSDINGMFDQAIKLAGKLGSDKPIDVPSYIRHPWVLLAATLAGAVMLYLAKLVMGWLYREHPTVAYKLMPWRLYEDWAATLNVFIALRKSGHSVMSAGRKLADHSGSPYIARALLDSATLAKKDGAAFTEKLVASGSIPRDLHGFFIDAGETGEVSHYFAMAEAFARQRINQYQDRFKTVLPSVVGGSLYLVIGIVAVDLFVKLSEAFIAPIL